MSDPNRQKKTLFNIRAEKLYREACDLFYSKKYDKALSLLEETTSIDKNHTKAFLLEGDIKLLNQGKEYEALNAYDKAILSNPCSTQALGSKAYVLDILGKYEEAFENCEKAFLYANRTDNDQMTSLYDQKISLLCSLKKYDDASHTLNEAVKNLSGDNGNYLTSCYRQKITSGKNAKKREQETPLKLIF
ncbi:MAG: hypothetical protein MJ180_02605 [Candidatus Gastranaerophilales bacterium]|nr:hypothetical protein [Candidatus Gastranaerophilales bacterium]